MGILTDLFDSWKEALLNFKPETVIRWHRQSFRLFWKWKSRSALGRPRIPQDQIHLIKQMAADNPLWGAARIHGEMLKLGFDISEATVVPLQNVIRGKMLCIKIFCGSCSVQ